MKKTFNLEIIVNVLLISVIANGYIFLWGNLAMLITSICVFALINALSGVFSAGAKGGRLRAVSHGVSMLLTFSACAIISIVFHIILAFFTIPDHYLALIWSMVFCICAEAIIFWNGIVFVYVASYQLGVKLRFFGILCGMIPILNIIMLRKIIIKASEEVTFEITKEKKELSRAHLSVCKTKYPILLVHGFFFRDFKHFNYWGRIPKTLIQNGATIYYGNHQSARPVSDSARELAERIKSIVAETGCEKLNVIAHSKGGLDMRYAIAHLGIAENVASLTTVNSPHRGCIYADHLLESIPKTIQSGIATTYNKTLKKLGDEDPDFIAAARDLTAEACRQMNEELPPFPENIYCHSIGSVMNEAKDGAFPLNLFYHVVSHYEGERNDGLVSEGSFAFGDNFTLVSPEGKGISHGDIIDLYRTNIKEFDVREFYVELISDLKNRGL